MSTNLRGYLSIVVAACLWGLAATVAKFLFASRSVPPLLLTQIRMGLASVLLAVALAVIAPRLLKIRKEHLGFFLVWGILGMASVQFTYLFTVSETNVATALFMQYMAPVLSAAYYWVFKRQRPSALLLTCLVLSVGGLLLLIFGGTERLLISPAGLIVGLLSAVAFSFYTIYGAKMVGQISPWTSLCYGLGIGFLFFLLIDLVFWAIGRPLPGTALLADLSMWPFFAYIAIFATVVPFGLYLTGLKWVPPTMANITGMLECVVGGLAAYFALGEALRPLQITGGALIIGAVALLQIRKHASST